MCTWALLGANYLGPVLDNTLFHFQYTPMKGKFSDYYTKEYKSGSLTLLTPIIIPTNENISLIILTLAPPLSSAVACLDKLRAHTEQQVSKSNEDQPKMPGRVSS